MKYGVCLFSPLRRRRNANHARRGGRSADSRYIRELHRVLFALLCAALVIAAAPDPDVQARQAFQAYSECVVKRHAWEASEVVLSRSTTLEIEQLHPDVLTSDCLYADDKQNADTMRLPNPDYLRYGLADALVRREYARGLPPDIARAAPFSHPELKESDYRPKPGKTPTPEELADLQKSHDRDAVYRSLSIYGECVARADPAGALRLILTNVGSAEEDQAFAAMGDALSACLTPGQTLKFGKTSLRGTVAMNLYRLAKAPKVPAAPVSK